MLTVMARTGTGRATAAVLIVLGVLWFFLDAPSLSLVAVAIGYAIAAVGVDLPTGYAGQPNFGQAAFMGIGGYAAVALQDKAGFGFLESFLAAIILCACVAAILGFAAVRLEHLGFGIVTFTFAFAVAAFLSGDALSNITGGPNGLAVPAGTVAGFAVAEPRTLYAIGFVVLAVGALVAHNFVRSRSGRAMLTAKANEQVASMLGIGTTGVKLRAFALSAAFGGAGGVIIGEGAGFITPASFPPVVSVTVFGMAAVGGIGTITGPILGAFFFWLVPSYVPGLASYQDVFVAAVFLVVLVVMPSGVCGYLAGRIGTHRRPPPTPADRMTWRGVMKERVHER